jgi:hypothetical protein
MAQDTNLPATPAGFISEGEVLERIPVCRRTLSNWRERGDIQFIRIGRRVLYHWPSVEAGLLRKQGVAA